MLRSWKQSKFAALALGVGPLSTGHAILDKTRFVAHLGVAYYAFHHWVWTPYAIGRFKSGAQGRTLALVKGGAALLFAAHEVNVAEKVARNSKDPLLQKLDGSLAKLQGSFANVGNDLKKGNFNQADLENLNTQTTNLSDTSAASGGQPIKDLSAPIPGL